MLFKKTWLSSIDYWLIFAILPLIFAGLLTMFSFSQKGDSFYFYRQLVWIAFGFFLFFLFSAFDWHFLKTSGVLFVLFIFISLVLFFLLLFGREIKGSVSWLNLPFFSIEPVEPAKLLLILVLSKYFSRRHIEISRFRHILISAFYAAVLAFLVFLQPDFGSALIIVLIWLGMIIVSGVNKKHLFFVFLTIFLIFSLSWFFIFKPYQKLRILTFFNPLKDPQGAGYNVLQSVIAVGSGKLWGKGLGCGTQSRLKFLPEYRTDFIFAAFAEEWGFIGVLIIFSSFLILIWRILKNALMCQDNFGRFFGIGMAIFLISHFAIHIGMNIGLLPVTGLSLPFLSYGGSNLVTIFAGLGILMGMRR